MKVSIRFLAVAASLCGLATVARLRADDAAATPPPAPPAGQATSPDAGPDAGPGGPHGRHGPRGGLPSLSDLTQKLSLTADQQAKVGAILANAKTSAKAVRDDDSLTKEDRRAKMHAIAKGANEQIRALLTADQQKTFDAMRPPHGHPGGPGGPGDEQGPPPPPPSS